MNIHVYSFIAGQDMCYANIFLGFMIFFVTLSDHP
jgi:hypothetical protein